MKTSSRLSLQLSRVATILLAPMLMLSAQTSRAGSATWLPSPPSNIWNNAANWTAGGPPNSLSDTATFNSSSQTGISLSATTGLNGIIFNPDASAYTITIIPGLALDITGTGIANSGGVTQNYLAATNTSNSGGAISFRNNATAGSSTVFTNNGGVGGTGLLGGNIGFRGTSSAGACTFVNNSGTINGAPGGTVQFYENSTAGNGVFTNRGSGVSGAREGYMYFLDSSTAGNGTFTNEGAAISGGFAGYLDLEQTSTASNGTFINNGGTASGAAGGTTLFFNTSTAGNATLIANAGSNGGNGGTISFQHDSTGGTARVEVFGNGSLFIANNPAGVMIGSLEGSGNVLLAAPNLTVGSNNLNTTFSGLIQDGGANGSVTKVGSGILTFEGGASNDHIADTVTLSILSGSTVNLNFTGTPDTIRSLIVGGIGRVPGLYGSAASGAPNQLPEFAGTGQIRVLAAVGTSPVITSPLVATGTVGLPFTYQFTASGATSLAVSNLPAGLAFSTSLGAITGIPTTAGIFPAGLSATSSQGTTNATLTITVQPVPSGLVVVSSTCATGRTGRPFSFQLRTIGGSSATRFAVENVLPPGLNLDSSTGFISGTPTSDGSFGLAVSAIDGAATTNATLQLTFTSDPTVPIITSPATAILTPGQVFTYTITADANGTFGYIGSDGIVHQAPSPSCAGLPAGLCFDGNHTISGTFNPPFGSDRRSLTRPNQTGGIITNVQLFSANPPNGASIISLFPLREVTGAKNIATRLAVGTGENVLIGGFIIAESVAGSGAPKKVVIRAIGPSLTQFGVPNALQDSTLELHDGAGSLLGSSDNWRDAQGQANQIIETHLQPTDDHEAALLAYLNPGQYTAVVRGKNNSTGNALVEVYDLGTVLVTETSNSRLANIATRGTVGTGDDVMIGGVIIVSPNTKVVVRAIGPSLTPFGISGALQDPTLELRNANGVILRANDDWGQGQPAEIQQAGLAPSDPRESALIETLQAGNYTATVSGKGGATGVAVVEGYALQ